MIASVEKREEPTLKRKITVWGKLQPQSKRDGRPGNSFWRREERVAINNGEKKKPGALSNI